MKEAEINKLTDDTLKIMYSKLLDQGVTIEDDEFDEEVLLDSKLLIRLLETPVSFSINYEGELIVVLDGNEILIDPKRKKIGDVADQERKLLSVLPEVPWDIYCQGIRRKQQETVAAYKVVVADVALKGIYKKKILNLISGYDFSTLRPIETNGETFASLLNVIEQDAGSVTKFLLACCSLKISSKKMKGEKIYIGILPEGEANFIRQVNESIGEVESRYSKLLENEPSKLQRLTIISQKDKEINSIVKQAVDNDVRMDLLLKISKLTSDNLPPSVKITIKEVARNELSTIIDSDFYNRILQKITRRAINQAVRHMQKTKFLQLMDPESDLSNILPKN